MRLLSSILAFLLGLAALAVGIGQLSVWAPQEISTAQTPEVEEAPLTVITDGVVDPADGREEFTIQAEGEYTIALARLDDIDAWVDDASHVRITGVEDGSGGESPSLTAEHVDGEQQVPDPSDSDLWVATETAEGSLEYRWVAPDDTGDWALMVFRDGEEAAPAALAVEVEQPVDRTLGIVMLVVGALLILLALVLFYRALAARRRERDVLAAAYDGEPAPGEAGAAAVTVGAADATDAADSEDAEDSAEAEGAEEAEVVAADGAADGEGPLDVDVEDRPGTEPAEPAEPTDPAEPQDAEEGAPVAGAATGAAALGTEHGDEAPSGDEGDCDTAAADPVDESDPADADVEPDVDADADSGTDTGTDTDTDTDTAREIDSETDAESDVESEDDVETPGEIDAEIDADASLGQTDEEAEVTDPAPESPAPESPAAEEPPSQGRKPRRRPFWWRSSSVAVLASVAVTAGPGVDIAADLQASPEEGEEQADDGAEEDEVEDGQDAGSEADLPEAGEHSVLLESQLQRILEDVVEVVEAGDADQDAEALEDRVGGNALEVRELAYRNQDISDAAGPEPLGSEPLAAAVTSASEFPRQAVVITQHEDAEIPQVLVIEQDSPRENYRLTEAVRMMPGTEFPAMSAEEGGVIPVDPETETARFTPEAALEGTAAFLNDIDDEFGEDVEENPYIEDLQSYQEEVGEAAADVEISYTRPLVEGSTTALRLADGSVLAVGSFDSTMELRPRESGDQIIFEDDTLVELAGTDSTTDDADVVNRESMILHIPAEEDQQVVVLGVHDIVSDVNILD